ncbi:hypothetical protein [Owenweeksia hongkongensis]|uniref:hypothetical protein n=1 Tax=Owenweeksia hongkongensis TaxID=253245 RepID=UPI003A93AFCF
MKKQLNITSSESKATLRFNIKESAKIVIKFLGITTWIVIFGMALLEIKQYYNIDVIPGVNTSIEDLHSAVFSGISKYFY